MCDSTGLFNAGGVTVSYFEWLKNLSHHRFGRIEKRFDQNTYTSLINEMEKLTGKTVAARDKMMITRGADEVDLVRSGLEETMINSYQQIALNFYKKQKDRRFKDCRFCLCIGQGSQ